jgi:hypothetical protein
MLKDIANILLSFGLTATFLTRLIEVTNQLFPSTSIITIGMSSLPSGLKWLVNLDNALSNKWAIAIICLLTFFTFVYELASLIIKILNKKKVSSN